MPPTSIIHEVAELEYRSLVNGAAQFYMANRNDSLWKWLGCLSAVLTALAAGSVTEAVAAAGVKELQGAITAVLVILLGVSTAALNFLDPKARRDSSLLAGKRLNGLRDQLRLLRRDDVYWEGVTQDQIRLKIEELQARYHEIESDMPTIPDTAHLGAKRDLKTNKFFVELRTVTGRGGTVADSGPSSTARPAE